MNAAQPAFPADSAPLRSALRLKRKPLGGLPQQSEGSMSYIIVNLLIGIAIGASIAALITWLLTRIAFSKEREVLQIRIAELQKERESDAEKLKWIESAEAQMREAFEALASRSLQVNADSFIGRAQEQLVSLLAQVRGDWGTQKAEIRGLVDPLQQSLSTIDGYMRELERQREGAYQGLKEQIQQLAQAQSELRDTTLTLAQALRSSTVRGRWGEMQLRRVVEMSGMDKHISFKEQVTADDGRPDMLVFLPNGGVIPVDSKAPMEAYLEAVSTSDDRTRKAKIDEHVRAIQGRVRELNQKQYWEQFEKSPEFVVMFVPSEACLSAAFDADPGLMEYAIERRVIITTPITLLALLKAVAYGWQQYQITENARRIAEEGKEFYSRLGIFAEHLSKVGEHLDKTVKEYNETAGSFERRLLPSARRLEECGVAMTEQLTPPEVIDTSVRPVAGDG